MAQKPIYLWMLFSITILTGLACGTPSQDREPTPAKGGSSTTTPTDEETDCTTTLKLVEEPGHTYLGSGQIRDLFVSRCTWCHSATASGSRRTLPYLTDLDLIRSQSNKIIQEIESGDMPPPQERMSFTSSEVDQIRTWIQDGLLEGTSPVWNTTKALTYGEMAPLITARCLPCHDTTINQAPLLNTQAKVEAQHAQVAAAIKANSMPPGVPFATDEKTVINNWSAGLSKDPSSGGDTQCP